MELNFNAIDVLRLEDGDFLVVTFDRPVTDDMAYEVSAKIKAEVGMIADITVGVILLGPGETIQIVRPGPGETAIKSAEGDSHLVQTLGDVERHGLG